MVRVKKYTIDQRLRNGPASVSLYRENNFFFENRTRAFIIPTYGIA